MIRRLASSLTAFWVTLSILRNRTLVEELIVTDTLSDMDLKPGAWFEVYLMDWMSAHSVNDPDDATSGIAKGADSGDWIWATATPEWDMGWFNSHGWRFPRKWVPFYYLSMSMPGEAGDTLLLRGL